MLVIRLKTFCLPEGQLGRGSPGPTAWHKHKEWNEMLLLGSQQSPLPKDLVQKIKAFQEKKLSSFL